MVEDDYLDVESVKRVLKKANIKHELRVVHNGEDAIGLLTQEINKFIPDIILLDINMPRMNGIEFLSLVRSYYSLKNIKVYILTTSSEQYDMLTTQNLGIAGYVVKPLDINHSFFKDNFDGGT